MKDEDLLGTEDIYSSHVEMRGIEESDEQVQPYAAVNKAGKWGIRASSYFSLRLLISVR
jgi:hypothetical protein